MNRFESLTKPLTWFMAILLAAFVAGCGSGNGSPAERVAPTVSSTAPADAAPGIALNANITATFSEAMNPSTITTATFTLKQGTTVVPGAVTYVGTTAIFNPTNDLAASTTYTATVTTGVKDLAGNALAVNKTWSFTTGTTSDTAPPTVNSTVPADLAPSVAVNANITATFSEVMDPSTFTTATFTLKQGTTVVPGAVTYLGTTATFNPTSDLAVSTTYTASITTGVKDLAGNALASNEVWSFTTGTTVGVGAINLGTAGNFAILTKTGIGDVPSSVITGNIGVSSTTGASIIVSCPELVAGPGIGQMFTDDAEPSVSAACLSLDKTAAGIAVADMGTAYTNASAPTTPAGVGPFLELGGGTVTAQTLVPGVYTWAGNVNITGDITLNGSATDVWIFQIGGTLDTDKNIILAGNAQAKNVFWRVADVVTLQGTSQFTGIILAQTRIQLITGATIVGRLLAQTRVDLDQNTVTQPAP